MTARDPMRLSSVEFDCETRRERNQRGASMGAVMALAARVKEQKRRTLEALTRLGSPPGVWFTPAGAAPSFTLGNEGGRGIWVPATTIAANGLTDVRNAFANPAVGRVLALESVGAGRTQGAALEVSIRPRSISASSRFSLVFSSSRARSRFASDTSNPPNLAFHA